jgi:uncharacterized protein (DUF1330 family)
VRGGEVETLEGDYGNERVVVLEFPSMEDARKFWNSADYAEVKALRKDAAVLDAWLVPGYEAGG